MFSIETITKFLVFVPTGSTLKSATIKKCRCIFLNCEYKYIGEYKFVPPNNYVPIIIPSFVPYVFHYEMCVNPSFTKKYKCYEDYCKDVNKLIE